MRTLVTPLFTSIILFSANWACASTFSAGEIAVLCEPMVPRNSSVIRANEGLITYRYSRTSQELTNSVRAVRPMTQQVGGTTSYKSDYTLKLSPVFWAAPIDGNYCYRIRAELELAKSPIEVSVASEYNEIGRQCSHEAILEHEMKHVRAYQSFMRYFSKEFLRQFEGDLEKIRLTSNPETVTNEINRTVLPELRAYIDTTLKRVQEINAEIDSPDEYERVRTACLR